VRRKRTARRPAAKELDPGLLISQLYDDLVEVEALAITADEACTQLPPKPSGKYGRIAVRLYTFVGKTAGMATVALGRSEDLVALRSAQLSAQSKLSPARRALTDGDRTALASGHDRRHTVKRKVAGLEPFQCVSTGTRGVGPLSVDLTRAPSKHDLAPAPPPVALKR
jgi:hypothetical protein